MFLSPRDFLKAAAEKAPDSVAVRLGEQQLSYGDLAQRVEALVPALKALGLVRVIRWLFALVTRSLICLPRQLFLIAAPPCSRCQSLFRPRNVTA